MSSVLSLASSSRWAPHQYCSSHFSPMLCCFRPCSLGPGSLLCLAWACQWVMLLPIVVLQDCALVQTLPGFVLPLLLGSLSLRNGMSSLLADMDHQLELVWRQQTGERVWPCIPQHCVCLLLSVSQVYCFSGMDLLILLNLAHDFCHCSTKPLVPEKCIKQCFGEFVSWHPKTVCQLCWN